MKKYVSGNEALLCNDNPCMHKTFQLSCEGYEIWILRAATINHSRCKQKIKQIVSGT